MSKEYKNKVVFINWVNGLSEEEKSHAEIMETFLEGFESEETYDSELHLMTTVEIIDKVDQMAKLSLPFVNIYLRLAGFKMQKFDGFVYWKLYSPE